MKRIFPFLTFSLLILFFLPYLSLSQKRLKEKVDVTAIEVPVRVFHKDRAVKDLTKKDFEIYEEGIKQEITSFETVARKISTSPGKDQPKKRLFFLIFNIFDYNEAVGEGIDFFFKNFFQPNDQLFILTENRVLNIESGKNLSKLSLNLKEALKKYKIISKQKILQSFKKINYEAERLVSTLQGLDSGISGPNQGILRFYENYRLYWFDFRDKYILPDIDFYRSIIRRIEMFEGEKWAICFQQREIFPKLKSGGRLESSIRQWTNSQADPQGQVFARLIQAKQTEFQRFFDFSKKFPVESLTDIFMEANLTFHLILLKSLENIPSQDFELNEVSQDYEDCLKKISFSTGGSSVFSNNVVESLQKMVEHKDFHYLLVYSPRENRSIEKRKIDIKVHRSGIKTVFSKYLPERRTLPITITHFKAERRSIGFIITNFEKQNIKGKLVGIADVNISIFDEDSNKVFSEGKTLRLAKKDVHVSIKLNTLKQGTYFIIIEVVDKISNEKDVYSSEIKFQI